MCPAGYYCPIGSAKPTPCPPGRKPTYSDRVLKEVEIISAPTYDEYVTKQKSISSLFHFLEWIMCLTYFYYTVPRGTVQDHKAPKGAMYWLNVSRTLEEVVKSNRSPIKLSKWSASYLTK